MNRLNEGRGRAQMTIKGERGELHLAHSEPTPEQLKDDGRADGIRPVSPEDWWAAHNAEVLHRAVRVRGSFRLKPAVRPVQLTPLDGGKTLQFSSRSKALKFLGYHPYYDVRDGAELKGYLLEYTEANVQHQRD